MDERLEGLRVTHAIGERLLAHQADELKEQVRLGETMMRVALGVLVAQVAGLGLMLGQGQIVLPSAAVFGMSGGILGTIVSLAVLVRGPPGGRPGAALGPDLRSLAHVADDPALTESRIRYSLIKRLPHYAVENERELGRLTTWRSSGARILALSLIVTAITVVYIGGGLIHV